MRRAALVRESLSAAWSSKVPSAIIALIVAAMCVMTISTVGRTAAAEAQVAERINSAGARELVVTDKRGAQLITPTLVDMASRLSVTDRAVGIGSPQDVKNAGIGPGATPVPAWAVVGDLEAVAHLVSGRMPGPGEALISTTALKKAGLEYPVGSMTSSDPRLPHGYAVVGSFTPVEPFSELGQGLIVTAPEGAASTNLRIVLNQAGQAEVAQAAILSFFNDVQDPQALGVSSPVELAQLHSEVVGDLGGFGRSLLYSALGIGALLVSIVVFADILVRRKDLGRRRALGATRGNIVWLMLLRSLFPAVTGGILGVVGGIVAAQQAGSLPPLTFCLGVLVLSLISAGLSTLVPASFAAFTDPVKVLRTP